MQRGINLGNAFDALSAAHDSLWIRDRHLDAIRAAGFDTVRLPVRWSAHAAPFSPFTIPLAFFDAVDHAIGLALERELDVVVNVHHYDELSADPDAHADRFLALWEQIAAQFAHHPTGVRFELLNEPRRPMTHQTWNRLLAAALTVVRGANPNRTVIVGPAAMNTIDALVDLELPADDGLVVAIHYYEPMAFTHQGAEWLPDAHRWLGTTWGSDADRAAVRADSQAAAAWADQRGRPLLIGEFGAYYRADRESRAAWTRFVRTTAEQLGMSWCYWDFGTDFGAYDIVTDTWRGPLRAALLDS